MPKVRAFSAQIFNIVLTKFRKNEPQRKGHVLQGKAGTHFGLQGVFFFGSHKIGDKKRKFHDIKKKNLTIYADTKKEQVNKE